MSRRPLSPQNSHEDASDVKRSKAEEEMSEPDGNQGSDKVTLETDSEDNQYSADNHDEPSTSNPFQPTFGGGRSRFWIECTKKMGDACPDTKVPFDEKIKELEERTAEAAYLVGSFVQSARIVIDQRELYTLRALVMKSVHEMSEIKVKLEKARVDDDDDKKASTVRQMNESILKKRTEFEKLRQQLHCKVQRLKEKNVEQFVGATATTSALEPSPASLSSNGAISEYERQRQLRIYEWARTATFSNLMKDYLEPEPDYDVLMDHAYFWTVAFLPDRVL